MTKCLFTIFCLIYSAQLSFANKVDDLKSDKDVLNFIKTVDTVMINPKYSDNIVLPSTKDILKNKNCDPDAWSWSVKNWVKADFNDDGHTDLLVTVLWDNYTSYVAIDKGDNTFKLININYSPFTNCELINTVNINNKQLILFHYTKPADHITQKTTPETDTLVFKFNSFIELSNDITAYKINSILFSTGPCEGSCPIFSMKIDKRGNATYNAISLNKKDGNFKATIKKEDLDTILSLLNYINIKQLKNKYSVNWFDAPGCSIKIKFVDGSVKTISDYGEQGTFGLKRLYALLFDLRDSQNWVSVK